MSMGRTIRIEYRNADAASGRLDDDAAELVRLKVDVIVAAPSPAIAAAKKATTTIPIVFLALPVDVCFDVESGHRSTHKASSDRWLRWDTGIWNALEIKERDECPTQC